MVYRLIFCLLHGLSLMLMFKTPLINIPNLSIILMFKKKPLVNIPKRDSIGYLMVYRLIVTRILYFIFPFLYSAFQIRLDLKLKVKM